LFSFVIPMAILVGAVKGALKLYEFVMTLQVIGKADEWILIIRNGKLKRADIGLSCFMGPFD